MDQQPVTKAALHQQMTVQLSIEVTELQARLTEVKKVLEFHRKMAASGAAVRLIHVEEPRKETALRILRDAGKALMVNQIVHKAFGEVNSQLVDSMSSALRRNQKLFVKRMEGWSLVEWYHGNEYIPPISNLPPSGK